MKSLSGPFIDEDASIGRPGTVITADWLNAVQAELAAMVTRFGGTLGHGETQIADLVENWRTRGDVRSALSWSAVDMTGVSGSILWTGVVADEPLCITTALQVIRLTGDLRADVLGSLAEGATAAKIAVLDKTGGAFLVAVVDSAKALHLFSCSISGGNHGTQLTSSKKWETPAGATLNGHIALSIDASAVRTVEMIGLGGMTQFCAYSYALDDGGSTMGATYTLDDDPESSDMPCAVCGDFPDAAVIVLHGSQIAHLGLDDLEPLSSDDLWGAAAGTRRARWFPGSRRICLWASGSANVWVGDPTGHAQSAIPWRRVSLAGPVLDLVESDGAIIALSVSNGALLCHRLPASGDPVLLSQTQAPGFSLAHSDLIRRRAFASVTRGVVWGHGYGYLFASADVRQGFRLAASTRGVDEATQYLLAADLAGRAVRKTSNKVFMSGIF